MRTFLAALGLASVIGSAGVIGSTGGGPTIETVYRSGSGPIGAFAQDGSLLAWFTRSSTGCNSVYVYSLDTGTTVTLPRQSPGAHNVTCRWEVGTAGSVRLAVAAESDDDDALWTLGERAPVPYDYALSAGALDRDERRFRELAHTPDGAGLWLGGIAGDGDTLVYSVAAVSYVDQVDCLAKLRRDACRLRVDPHGSGIRRLSGRKDPLVPGTGPALSVAVSGDELAYVPAAAVGAGGRPVATADRAIPVVDALSGDLIAAARPLGVPQAIALAPGLLAVLTRAHGGQTIAWYDAATGLLEDSVAVPAGTSPELSASGDVVVFRVGLSIRTLDVESGEIREVAQAGATPVGLSIEGTRVAWAENRHGLGRVLDVHLG